MTEPASGWGERLALGWSTLRNRPDIAVFAVGMMLFAAGVWTLIGDQLDPPSTARLSAAQSPSPAQLESRVGPSLGEAVDPYIADRKSVTSDRAAKAPKETTFGIVVFNSYRKASEVDALMKSRGLEALTIMTRIPVAGFEPRQVPVDGRTIVEAALAEKAALSKDLEVLEEVAKDVTEADFKSVYQHDLQLHRDAINQLGDDPETVYGVVVKGTNQAMGRTTTSAQVRYVDLPADPTDTPEDTTFVALIPEDTQTSSVGPLPENASPPPA